MTEPFVISYVVLWAFVIVLAGLLLVVYRQLGEMYLGTAEGRSRDGLALGTTAPEFELPDQRGTLVKAPPARSLVLFGTPGCAPCRALLPDLVRFSREQPGISVIFVAGENAAENAEFAGRADARFPVLTQPGLTIAHRYRVRSSPFAFYIDEHRAVRAKGIVNRYAQLVDLVRRGGALPRDLEIAPIGTVPASIGGRDR